jgi:hypothetical protein
VRAASFPFRATEFAFAELPETARSAQLLSAQFPWARTISGRQRNATKGLEPAPKNLSCVAILSHGLAIAPQAGRKHSEKRRDPAMEERVRMLPLAAAAQTEQATKLADD